MKKYIQSTVYVLFVLVTFFALIKSFMTYKNPLNFYENPLVWFSIIGFVAVIILKEVVNFIATEKAKELQNEKDGIIPEVPKDWLKELLKSWTKSKAIEEEQEIILDHNYDGIKELDNSLPPWWVYMFYATIVFAVVYLVRFQVMDGDTPAMEYEKAVAQARLEINKFKSTAPDLITAENVILLTDASDLKRGRAIFNINCASCHLSDGGGSIGPNLTDEYWILGGGIKNVFTTISNGGRSGKGMIAWNKTLKPADMAKVSSYVLSMQGTTPAQAKEPQGEKWVEEAEQQEVPEAISEELNE
ncbi:c-type cytochrome [Polaribacter litorisediminis]|uniref:cbb3-type cytochrome c oxidase N-terminal domain-containing protein n=1 Tax=Polaribacter litorisediminis TaxID=1908341 RepID=UPI001CBF4DC3|nr:cbb3-type cytochrome c oxidase N-terminal domain-containing protein [Polaribacter litorisediminis]UAM99330.1 c-type cytochrome [Polaribacter litorisediminis]